MSRRAFLVVGLVAAVLLAGAALLWASAHPDGLEFVSREHGFADRSSSPARRGGAAWSLGGLFLVALVAGGLFWGLRRRGSRDEA
jgi:hypothetical protein